MQEKGVWPHLLGPPAAVQDSVCVCEHLCGHNTVLFWGPNPRTANSHRAAGPGDKVTPQR